MTSDQSALSCFNDLVTHFVERKRVYLQKPRWSPNQQHKRLKKTAFDTLFAAIKHFNTRKFLSKQFFNKFDNDSNSEQLLYDHIFQLHLQGCHTTALKFTNALQKLDCAGYYGCKETVLSVLMVLFRLSYTPKEKCQETYVIDSLGFLPYDRIGEDLSDEEETCPPYLYYPRELFQQDPGCTAVSGHEESDYLSTMKLLSLCPGSGLPYAFNTKGGDAYEEKTQQTLGHALTIGRVTSWNTKLDFPTLPENPELVELRIPPMFERNFDEGYESSCASLDTSVKVDRVMTDSGINADIMDKDWPLWKEAVIGPVRHVKQKPFLTEAGCKALDAVYILHRHALSILDQAVEEPELEECTMQSLTTDVFQLLVAVPSTSFYWNQVDGCFRVTPNLYISGITPQVLSSSVQDFCHCGTNYYRLKEFSSLLDLHSKGLVFQAFADALQNYLQHYEVAILNAAAASTPTQLSLKFQLVMDQVQFVAELCHCSTGDGAHVASVAQQLKDFPTGISLLSYLYNVSNAVSCTHHYVVVLTFLKAALKPYLIFLRDWSFYGLHYDPYREFPITVNEDTIDCRDWRYWCRSYHLVVPSAGDRCPLPLLDNSFTKCVYTCGKTLNLLQIIQPMHFLLETRPDLPALTVTFSRVTLDQCQRQWELYSAHMKLIASELSKTRQQILEQEEERRRDLVNRARQASKEQMDKFLEEQKNIRLADLRKKAVYRDQLERQLDQQQKRKNQEKETEKAEDLVRIEKYSEQELIEAQVEKELEKQARDELIQYYAKLTGEAAQREQRALWRVQRTKLAEQRRIFFEEDKKLLMEQLEDVPKSLTNLPPFEEIGGAENLPLWATNPPTTTDQGMGHVPRRTARSNVSAPGLLKSDAVEDSGDSRNRMVTVFDLQAAEAVHRQHTGQSLQVERTGAEHPAHSTVQELMYGETNREKKGVKQGDTGNNRAESAGQETLKQADEHPDQKDEETSKRASPEKTGSRLKWTEPKKGEVLKTERARAKWTDPKIREEVNKGGSFDLAVQQRLKTLPIEKLKTRGSIQRPAVRFTKKVEGRAVEHETQATEVKATQRPVSGVKVSDESADCVKARKLTHGVAGVHVAMESIDEVFESIPRFKHHLAMSASKESHEVAEVKAIKMVGGAAVNVESTEEYGLGAPRLKKSNQHATTESTGTAAAIPHFQRGLFAHLSQMTMGAGGQFEQQIPKIRRRQDTNASVESDWKSFQVKRFRKQVEGQSVSEESAGERAYQPRKKVSEKAHPSSESEWVDREAIQRSKFKMLNVHGRTSDSTIERIMYKEIKEEIFVPPPPTEINLISDVEEVPFISDFDFSAPMPDCDLMRDHQPLDLARNSHPDDGDIDVDIVKHMSLPSILEKCVAVPLLAQASLVNKLVLNHFYDQLRIGDHFQALQQFLLMQDGEFAQSLGDQLFDMLATRPSLSDVYNPLFLYSVVQRSMRLAVYGNSSLASKVNYVIRKPPSVFKPNMVDCLDGLDLTYETEWPVNLVITPAHMIAYSRLACFKLKLRRTVWVLNDIWYKLKRQAGTVSAAGSPQLRQLQLYRHEMQYFAGVMQGYLSNQVINITWQEFQDDLGKVKDLDDLTQVHTSYLDRCLFRCMLTKKTERIQNLVTDIFSIILKFHNKMFGQSWVEQADGHVIHPAYESLVKTYQEYMKCTKFLYRVVHKLAVVGYQAHLEELLLRLNFNRRFSDD